MSTTKLILKESLAIKIPALKRPSLAALKKQFPWIEKIEKDDSTTKPVNFNLYTLLKDGETYINGSEYESRREGLTFLGFQHATWLAEHQDKFPVFKELVGKVYTDFPGIIVVGADGSRSFPYLHKGGTRFVQRWFWTGSSLDDSGRVAVSARKGDLETPNLNPLEPSDPLDLVARIQSLESDMQKVKQHLIL